MSRKQEAADAWLDRNTENIANHALKWRDAFRAGWEEALDLAAQHCCTSHAGDCCHETADNNAEAMRKLKE